MHACRLLCTQNQSHHLYFYMRNLQAIKDLFIFGIEELSDGHSCSTPVSFNSWWCFNFVLQSYQWENERNYTSSFPGGDPWTNQTVFITHVLKCKFR